MLSFRVFKEIIRIDKNYQKKLYQTFQIGNDQSLFKF